MIKKTDSEILKSIPVAEYMKIRQYVIDLVLKSEHKSVMIPSMPKLGEMFGVARMTVHKALKDLIKDKYLISRPGIGTFINPDKIAEFHKWKPSSIIGLIAGDGMNLYYDYYFGSLAAHTYLKLVECGYIIKPITLTSSDPEKIASEMKNYSLAGLVWISPGEKGIAALKKMEKAELPVVTLQGTVEGINSVNMDYELEGYEAGKNFLEEGRRNVVFAVTRDIPLVHLQLDGLKRAFSEAGVKFNSGLVLKDIKDLDYLFELGIDVQAIYLEGPYLPETMSVLQDRRIDTKKRCRILTGRNDIAEVQDFRGLVRNHLFEDEAVAVVNMISRMLIRKDFRIEHKLIKFPLYHVGIESSHEQSTANVRFTTKKRVSMFGDCSNANVETIQLK